jgi:hypothetical protein
MQHSDFRILKFWSAVVIFVFLVLMLVMPMGLLFVIVLSLLLFGGLSILEALFTFQDERIGYRTIFAIIGTSVLAIGILIIWLFLDGYWILSVSQGISLIILLAGIALLLYGLHWVIPIVYRLDFLKGQNHSGWLILVIGIVEMILAAFVILYSVYLWIMVFVGILLSAINLAISSKISTRYEWDIHPKPLD